MSDIKLVSWEEIFLKTVNETDPEKLAQLLPEPELAMLKRELELYDCSQHREELNAMRVAFGALGVAKHEITKQRVGPSKGNAARFAKFARRSQTA